jgi:GNAT superfamily N-acetyltransferase
MFRTEILQEDNGDIILDVVKNEEEKKESLNVVQKAFSTYRLFTWMNENNKNGNQREVTDFFCRCAQIYALKNNGIILVARDRISNKILGASHLYVCQPAASALGRFFHRTFSATLPVMYTLFSEFSWSSIIGNGFKFLWRTQCFDKLDEERMTHFAYNEPHIYLLQLAVDPEIQARGIGSVMLKGILKMAQDLNLPVYLETDEIRLKNFYSRHGFEVKREYSIVDGDSVFEPNFGMVAPPKIQPYVQLETPNSSNSKSE